MVMLGFRFHKLFCMTLNCVVHFLACLHAEETNWVFIHSCIFYRCCFIVWLFHRTHLAAPWAFTLPLHSFLHYHRRFLRLVSFFDSEDLHLRFGDRLPVQRSDLLLLRARWFRSPVGRLDVASRRGRRHTNLGHLGLHVDGNVVGVIELTSCPGRLLLASPGGRCPNCSAGSTTARPGVPRRLVVSWEWVTSAAHQVNKSLFKLYRRNSKESRTQITINWITVTNY